MTRATPRQRAAAAFAVIDRHHANPVACPHWAYTELAEAMHQIYGPLPSEGLTLAHIAERPTVLGACGSQGGRSGAPLASSPEDDG